MRFSKVQLNDAEGSILAHGVRAGGRLLKKGRVLGKADLEQLSQAGILSITVATLESDDVPEDVAAARIAGSLAGNGTRVGAAFTGRSNLYAATSGLMVFDPETIHAMNEIDESITIATLSLLAPVNSGEMIATVKIIP